MNSVRHAGGVRLGGDRRDVAAVGLAQVPDPHPLAFEAPCRYGARPAAGGDELSAGGVGGCSAWSTT